jgi:glycosyltransferase involved in cell wall biosynthesis
MRIGAGVLLNQTRREPLALGADAGEAVRQNAPLPSLRVLYCIPTMEGGGAERQLTYLVEDVVGRGVQVHVVLRRGGANLDRLLRSGATIHHLRARSNYSPLLFVQLFRLARKVRPHLVQTYLTQMDVLGGTVAKLLGVPWILAERSSAAAYSSNFRLGMRLRTGRIADRAREHIAVWAAAIVANSVGGIEYWTGSGLPPSRLHHIGNGVAVSEIVATRPPPLSAIGLREGPPFILSAGRFDEGKNPTALVDAFARIAAKYCLCGVICGTGPLLEQMRTEVASRELNQTLLLPGYVQGLSGLMKSARAFVSASRFEGCPNAVLEAMAMGCPLVVSDIPAHREILDDASAVFVDPERSEDIQRGIEIALNEPEVTTRRREAARSRLAGMSVPNMADKYMDLYTQLRGRAK